MSTAFCTGPRALVARGSSRALAAAREVVLVVGVFTLYELGRLLVRDQQSRAFGNARAVVEAEGLLPLPREATLQRWLLHSDSALLQAANVFYVSVHFPATVAFLVWMWVRRPDTYAWARSLLVLTTLVALALHITFPLAPPRMLPGFGFVDTMAAFGPSAYGGGTQSVTNQYAAMPSLHVAWALVIGVVFVATLHGWWRWLALLHPLLTMLVVVVTANHYWLDGLAAGVLVGAALLVLTPPEAVRRHPRTVFVAEPADGPVQRV